MTPFIKKKEIKNDWYIINAENAVVGRLAAYISKVLRGKNKATYNPHMDNGDFIVVTNVEKIKSLEPAFDEDGSVTAATASPISIGASAYR